MLCCLVGTLTLLGCSNATPKLVSAPSLPRPTTLGSSYNLLPLPSEETSLLGRVLPFMPQPGQSIAEIARPNPCGHALSVPQASALHTRFEDSETFSSQGSARARLQMFGLSANGEVASRFVYRLRADQKLVQVNSTAYEACCRQYDCGVGYVSELVHGEGEYAAVSQRRASGDASIGPVGAGISGNHRVLSRRQVRGWLAALITVTGRVALDRLQYTIPPVSSGEPAAASGHAQRVDESGRSTMAVLVLSGATAASAALMIYGIANWNRPCDSTNAEFRDPECMVSKDDPNAVRYNPFGPDGKESFDRHYSPELETDNSTGQVLAVVGGLATAASVTFLTLTLARSSGRNHERQPAPPTLSLSAGAVRSGLGMGMTGAF